QRHRVVELGPVLQGEDLPELIPVTECDVETGAGGHPAFPPRGLAGELRQLLPSGRRLIRIEAGLREIALAPGEDARIRTKSDPVQAVLVGSRLVHRREEVVLPIPRL